MMKVKKIGRLVHFSALTALLTLAWTARAQEKDGKALIASACANEYKSDRTDHTAFIYRDHDVTPDHDTLYAIVETPEGNLRKKLEDHGHPLSPQDRSADDARIQALLHNPAAQSKLKKDAAHDDEQADQLLNLLPTAFLWNIVSENRIRSMRGEMVDDVKIMGGFIGKLHKGGTFQVEHREVAPHHWQLTELHVHIVGHILFNFKTIGSQEDELKTDFKVSPAQDFQQAYDILYQKPVTSAKNTR